MYHLASDIETKKIVFVYWSLKQKQQKPEMTFESWDIAPLYSDYEGVTLEQAQARNERMAKRKAKRLAKCK